MHQYGQMIYLEMLIVQMKYEYTNDSTDRPILLVHSMTANSAVRAMQDHNRQYIDMEW